MAVPVSRPCRGSADGFVRTGAGLLSEGGFGLGISGKRHGAPGHSERGRWVQSNADTRLKVLLADDHSVMRQTLKKLLTQQADIQLVGETDNGLETLSLVKQLQPDLLVTDLMMPGLNGLEVTRRIRLSFPSTLVVVVSVNCDEPYVAGAFRCGANAFVLKSSCGRHLIPAVRAVLAGHRYVSPPLSEPLI